MKKITALLLSFIVIGLCSFVLDNEIPKGLQKGDKAPLFEGKDQHSQTVKLTDLLQKGDVVLVFYRGQWCPFCNKYLSALQDSLGLIQKKGASVIAISPEKQENIGMTVSKTKATFPVITDTDMKIMTAYKVNYTVDKEMQDKLASYGLDLNKANGENGNHLPVPATYIISKNGTIKYVFFNPDYTKRPSVKELLNLL
jgi:peroxiredoxin